MSMIAINKINYNLKMKRFKMPNAPYSNRCSQYKKQKPSTNIKRETKLKSPRTNSTFSFCRHAIKPNLKNQKSYFFHPFFALINLMQIECTGRYLICNVLI